ncbi:Fumarylpyruvate hydrolase [Terricaulis silvestris]|uniref:Fumarylpyruvate hydrolase n=2 Tax=Terricaulis silvestris TaxID=2686094 RepID=A0A6I6MQJ7_9CAUL|nr:Fumarylpyruvate hydrolase [Terricaulis silvestris]
MGNDPKSEPPVFFTKPADAVVESGSAIPYATQTSNLHHEVELLFAIGKDGAEIAEATARDHVWGYAVGVDLTRRDLQAAAKQAGGPWDASKGFDNSAPIGPLTPASAIGHLSAGTIQLSVNGAIRQNANLSEMIWTVPEIVAALSRTWALKAGDLVFTGTPSGVGPLHRGDAVAAEIAGLSPLRFTIK